MRFTVPALIGRTCWYGRSAGGRYPATVGPAGDRLCARWHGYGQPYQRPTVYEDVVDEAEVVEAQVQVEHEEVHAEHEQEGAGGESTDPHSCVPSTERGTPGLVGSRCITVAEDTVGEEVDVEAQPEGGADAGGQCNLQLALQARSQEYSLSIAATCSAAVLLGYLMRCAR